MEGDDFFGGQLQKAVEAFDRQRYEKERYPQDSAQSQHDQQAEPRRACVARDFSQNMQISRMRYRGYRRGCSGIVKRRSGNMRIHLVKTVEEQRSVRFPPERIVTEK